MGAADRIGVRGFRLGIAAAAVAACGGCVHRAPPRSWDPDPSPFPTGANTDPASALRPTEGRIGAEFAGVLAAADKSDVLGTAVIDARLSSRWVSVHAGWSYTWLDVHDMEGGTHVAGNLRGGVAGRWMGVPDKAGAAYRRAIGFRLDVADGDGAEARAVLQRRPFELMQFGPGRLGQLTGEVRYELLGYYAPFVHFQAGFVRQIEKESELVAFPLALTLGMHADTDITVYGELGVEFGRGTVFDRDATDRVDRLHTFTRLRFGVDFDYVHLRPGLSIDVHLGPIDGVFANASIAFPVDP